MRFPKTLIFFILAMAFALPAWAQQKPFTQEQVVSMVRAGLGEDSGAKLVEQRGIDFTPSNDLIQTLKAAGASEAFLNAVRAAKPPEPASAKKPINQVQVFALLVGQVPSHRVTLLVQERGIDFEPPDDYLQEVRLAGGEDELVGALKNARVTKPESVDPAVQARQSQVQQHAAHGAEFFQKKQYASAEQEFRTALLFDPQDSGLYAALATVLNEQKKWDDAAVAAREALHLDPNNENAHVNLGFALASKGDWDGAITEDREALSLNPNDDMAHNNLGLGLTNKGDTDGEITECREALRLNPKNDLAHINLGFALGSKGDWDGEIAEERKALRLNANDEQAHVGLGVALGAKGDQNGAIAEFREALRLNPSYAYAHYGLGLALEIKSDRRRALEEYRSAYELDSKNSRFRKAYERLLQQVSQ